MIAQGRGWIVVLSAVLVVGCESMPQDPGVPLPAFASVASGGRHTCALTRLGSTVCWGLNTFAEIGAGVLGGGPVIPSVVPVDVDFERLSTGAAHTCGVTADGQTLCWGWSADGQLGARCGTSRDGSPSAPRTGHGLPQAWCRRAESRRKTRRSAGATTETDSSATGAWSAATCRTCAVDVGGDVYCWGLNDSRQLGRAGPDALGPVKLGG